MTDQPICLTIDGEEIECSSGCTVFEAAAGAGIHIPTFCHHPKLEPVGACRMCLVEIGGARGLQTSCTTPVREGMVVKVHTSPEAVKARRANFEFLLTNHPLDCPVCDKGGECPLQDQALAEGPGESRYVEEKRHKNKRYPLGELIVLDQERCVLCWRCIRYLDDWAGDHELDLFGRGASTRIDVFPGHPLCSKWQGNTIDICPVGALTSRVFRFTARVWELTDTPSVCAMCSVGCNITLGVKNNELLRITPLENMQINDAWICDKGRFTHGYVDHADRLKTPLIRRDGELQPASWNEALDLMVENLTEILESDGPQAIAGIGSARATNEANYLFQRLLRTQLGTNSIDHLGRMPDEVVLLDALPDLEERDAVLLLGCDPSTEAPLVELWLKKGVLRHGSQVLVANPWQVELGRYGGPWLGYRPGSQVTLLNGLGRQILDAGVESQASRVSNMDEIREGLRGFDGESIEQATGVPTDLLAQAAQILSSAKRPAILYGSGFIAGAQGTAALDALMNLTRLLDDLQVGFLPPDNNSVGAIEMGVAPHLYPGRQSFSSNKVRNRLSSFWGAKLSPVKGLDFEGMVGAANEGNLKALWAMGADLDGELGASLEKVPFLVVQDLFLTATAQQADIVLPAASFAETDGSYTNLTGQVQALRAAKRPPGEAKPDWWIVLQVAQSMADDKQRRAWEFAGPADILDEFVRVSPGYRGLSYKGLLQAGWQRPAQPLGTGRALARVEAQPPIRSSGYPLLLASGPLLYDRGTLLQHSERIQKLVPQSYVLVHSMDAKELDLVDGDEVSITSMAGQLTSMVKIGDSIAPGTVFVPENLHDLPLSALSDGLGTPIWVNLIK